MRCSCAETRLVAKPPFPTSRRGVACPLHTGKNRDLTHPGKIKCCVLDLPHLLFGRFPCTAMTHSRPRQRHPADCESPQHISITGFEALLPNESEPGEPEPFIRLA